MWHEVLFDCEVHMALQWHMQNSFLLSTASQTLLDSRYFHCGYEGI